MKLSDLNPGDVFDWNFFPTNNPKIVLMHGKKKIACLVVTEATHIRKQQLYDSHQEVKHMSQSRIIELGSAVTSTIQSVG